MRVAVTGASGLIGNGLVSALRARGDEVVRLVRRAAGAGEIRWDPGGTLDPGALEAVDAVVHLAGEPTAPASLPGAVRARWTAERKRAIHDSRSEGTRTIAEAVRGAGTPLLVCASGVHCYGDRGDEVLTEDSAPGSGFLAGVVRDWEAAADPAREGGARVVHLRTGVVQDPEGGALAVQLPLFKLGLGGRAGSGRQWIPWIHVDDVDRRLPARPRQPDPERPRERHLPQPRHGMPSTPRPSPPCCTARRSSRSPRSRPSWSSASSRTPCSSTACASLPSALEADGYTFRFTALGPALRDLLDR